MRKTDWKAKVIIMVAFIIGIAAGITAGVLTPEHKLHYRGLIEFGTIAIGSMNIIVACVKIFHIGRD